MIWDGFNKRKFPRATLRCELTLKDKPQAEEVLKTQTENVGAGGVCVILERRLDRFAPVWMRLELDPSLPWIEGKGKVVWAVATQSSPTEKKHFDTGIEFVGLDTGQQELIRRYVESRAPAKEKNPAP